MTKPADTKTETTPPEPVEDIEAKQEKCSHETVIADRCTECKKKMD